AQAQAQAQAYTPPPVFHPARPPKAHKAVGLIFFFALFLPLIIGGISAAVWVGGRGFDGLLGGGGLLNSEHLLWDDAGGVPQVVTVDGQSAVVGRTRAVGNEDHLYCGVYDSSGEQIWRTESLGSYSAGYQYTFCGAVGDAMIATDSQMRLQIFALATGERRKAFALSMFVDYLCVPRAPEHGNQAWFKQIDERSYLIDPATGELTESPRPDWCFASRHEAERALEGGGNWANANAKDANAPEIDRLKLEFVYQRGDKAVALGHPDPGLKVPTAVGYDPTSQRVLWQQTVPSVPIATVREADKYGVIAGDKFVTTYGAGQEDWYITALDLDTGKRIWETKLRPLFAVDWVQGLVASDTHAFLVRTSSLEIFDVRTGELTGTIGKETYD
ncbi:MAG TPA: PQQ-binding-like beta-propeller repeat protein, partial [Enhygromyxa sp.]|nr:PQQ-binding-like beta-propeller repeat protein [Enhygromyxa sp.]